MKGGIYGMGPTAEVAAAPCYCCFHRAAHFWVGLNRRTGRFGARLIAESFSCGAKRCALWGRGGDRKSRSPQATVIGGNGALGKIAVDQVPRSALLVRPPINADRALMPRPTTSRRLKVLSVVSA
jgi:hypothetical protein